MRLLLLLPSLPHQRLLQLRLPEIPHQVPRQMDVRLKRLPVSQVLQERLRVPQVRHASNRSPVA